MRPETARKNTEAERKAPQRMKENWKKGLSRTKSKIFELALCNSWEWFATLTLNPEYHDRKDLKSYKARLSTWIKNYNRLHKNEYQISANTG